MSWVGGKKALRDAIVTRLCHSCDRYVEVFGGGGWVLFHKTPGKFEVYNDFNPNLANLYRCVRDHPEELCEELRYSLNSRTDFEHIREVLRSKTAIPDIRRAAYFYQIIRESYASGLDSFGAQPHNMWRNFPLITEASRRLQNVVIENKDFEKLIAQYSSSEIKTKIKRQTEKYGWEFIFLAANIDAVETAESIGIRRERAANWLHTKEGVGRSYYAMCEAITSVRMNCADKMDLEEYLKEDDKE